MSYDPTDYWDDLNEITLEYSDAKFACMPHNKREREADKRNDVKSEDMLYVFDQFLFKYFVALSDIFQKYLNKIEGYDELVRAIPLKDLDVKDYPENWNIEKFYKNIREFELLFKTYVQTVESKLNEHSSTEGSFKFFYNLPTNNMIIRMIPLKFTRTKHECILDDYKNAFEELAMKHTKYIFDLQDSINHLQLNGHRVRDNMWHLFALIDSLYISSYFLIDKLEKYSAEYFNPGKYILLNRPFESYIKEVVVSKIAGYKTENDFLLRYSHDIDTLLAMLYIERFKKFKKEHSKHQRKDFIGITKTELFSELIKVENLRERISIYANHVYDSFEEKINLDWYGYVKLRIEKSTNDHMENMIGKFLSEYYPEHFHKTLYDQKEFERRKGDEIDPRKYLSDIELERGNYYEERVERKKNEFEEKFKLAFSDAQKE